VTQVRMQANELAFYKAGEEAGAVVTFGQVAKLLRDMKASYAPEVKKQWAERTKGAKTPAARKQLKAMEESLEAMILDVLERIAVSMDQAQGVKKAALAKAVTLATNSPRPSLRKKLGKIVDAVFEEG
jgi:hypothetical protein